MLKKFFLLSTFLVAMCLTSCDPTFFGGSTTISIIGTASISKNPVRNGDEVELFIAPVLIGGVGISVDNSITINGKTVGIPNVYYYIDDQEVGHSHDKANKFRCVYKVANLAAGEHELRAEAVPQEKGTTFTGGYTSTTFSVEE